MVGEVILVASGMEQMIQQATLGLLFAPASHLGTTEGHSCALVRQWADLVLASRSTSHHALAASSSHCAARPAEQQEFGRHGASMPTTMLTHAQIQLKRSWPSG